MPRHAAAVAIDVLRATSTLATAFVHGASRASAFATVDAARTAKRADPEALLCGERDGRRIEGFDLGNSPAEYTRDRVAGRRLLFASTNGSRAILSARTARHVLIASFANASAVLAALAGERHVVLVCAGKVGRFAIEDAACAGWLCARLADAGATLEGPAARLCAALAPRDASAVRDLVQDADHGRALRAMGEAFAADVEVCATLDGVAGGCDWRE